MQNLLLKFKTTCDMGFWFGKGSDSARFEALEAKVSLLERKIASAADILEATERMDRIIKRSFRLQKQIDALEEKGDVPRETVPGPTSRQALVRKLYG